MHERAYPEAILLGEPVDLWAGLTPAFPASGRPWRLPPGRPLRTECATLPPDPVQWGAPSLSLHESVPDLLNHLFDYAVHPMIGLDGPQALGAGALMAGKPLAALEARLQLDLSIRPAPAFLLARLTGSRGTRHYTPEWKGCNRKVKIIEWLTPEGRAAMARLRLRDMRHEGAEFYGDVTARQARRFVDYFDAFGTHLVRSITYGEQLFQVFAVDGDRLAGLKQCFAGEATGKPVCGPVAFGMAHLTRRPWVSAASPILAASDGADAQAVAPHAIWASGAPGEPPSLLSPQAMSAWSRAPALAQLAARSIIGVGFACQALYLEDHRADAWTRILRAGLCQRFPDATLAGWRAREPRPMPAFLASAALTGEEALCRTPAPALPHLALALDVSGDGRIVQPLADCLALFAATDPGTGRAAHRIVDEPSFDPAQLAIPFLDGALCITDGEGQRFCLVEGVWIGAMADGRPGIVGAPAEPDSGLLVRHAPQLESYLRLLEQLQQPGVPLAVAAATKRAVAWLAEVTAREPGLSALHWQALRIVRGAGRIEPDSLAADRLNTGALGAMLAACMDLLALPAISPHLAAAAQRLDAQLWATYGDLAGALDAAQRNQEIQVAGEALAHRFAGLAAMPNLPEHAAALFTAGAALCLPPDLHWVPHGIAPGDEPYAILWNALLALRACYAECRSTLLSLQGHTAEAAALLEREIIGPGEGPADPAVSFLAALDALADALPPCDAAELALLCSDMEALLALRRSIRLFRRADAGQRLPGCSPQLHRLVLLLETLQLCRAVGIPLAPLDSLAPAAFAARIDEALTALAQSRRYA